MNYISALRNKPVSAATTYYHDGTGEISEYKPSPPQYTWGAMLNKVDGYYYFGLLSKGGAPLNRSHYVIKYDRATNTVLQKVHVPKSAEITSSFDSHPAPVIHCDELGHVYSVVERGAQSTGASDGHNTDLLVYKTTTAGDLTTLTLWKTLPGKYSYPKIWKIGSNYFIGGRGKRAAQDLQRWTLEQSTDGGATWTERIIIAVTSADSQLLHIRPSELF